MDAATIYARRWYILGVLTLSLVIIVAGNSSLNVALPTIVRELHASSSQLEWIVDAYSLVFAGLVLPMGALGDRFGRKGVLQIGLVLFAVAALGGCLANTANWVIAARAVMGIGAAMIMPATLSIVANVFPPEERSRAIAIWAGFAGAGVSVGPPASGFLLNHFWFGSVFFINLPIVAVALVAGAFLLPTSRDPRHVALDIPGAAFSVAGLTALLFGIIQAPDRGWSDGVILAAFAAAIGLLVTFVWWELHSDHPMLPMEQFRDRRFSAGAGCVALTFFAMFGLFFIASQYMQFVLGFSPLRAGCATLPMAAMMVFVAPRSARLADRFGRNRVMAVGLTTVATGMLVMSTLTPTTGYLRVAIALVLFGTGMGLTTAPATGAIMESMPLAKAGVGSAVNDTTREVGGALGVAVLGSLLATVYGSHLAHRIVGAPATVVAGAKHSIGAALRIAAGAPPPFNHVLATAARRSFTDGMHVVFLVSASIVVLTALLEFFAMPDTRGGYSVVHPPARDDEEPEAAPTRSAG
jgi:EmrB/QacA subfamily drug resistance transporter